VRIEDAIRYSDATPDAVFAMIATEEFQRRKCAATGASSYDVQIKSGDSHTVIVCTRILPTDSLPDFVRPLAGPRLELIENIDWGEPNTTGARFADVRLQFTGQPLSMVGRLRLRAEGDDTTAALRADLQANVPIFGGRIEKACAPLVEQALRIEQQVGQKWLAERR
jgi:Protein of unknown function (DUF2505)